MISREGGSPHIRLIAFNGFPTLLIHSPITSTMAQVFNRLGGIFPKGSGKGIAGGAGALITLGALGYGLNAALFNGNQNGSSNRLSIPSNSNRNKCSLQSSPFSFAERA